VMRPQDGGRPNAQPQQPLEDRRRIHSPYASRSASVREHTKTNHPREQDNGTRPGGEGTTNNAAPPPLTRTQHLPPITRTSLEDAIRGSTLETPTDSPHYCRNPARHGDPHHLPTLLETPLMGGALPLSIVPFLTLNKDTPWQPIASCDCFPSPSPGATNPDTLRHPHTPQTHPKSSTPAYLGPTLPSEYHNFAP